MLNKACIWAFVSVRIDAGIVGVVRDLGQLEMGDESVIGHGGLSMLAPGLMHRYSGWVKKAEYPYKTWVEPRYIIGN
jgi:hypothetical protein